MRYHTPGQLLANEIWGLAWIILCIVALVAVGVSAIELLPVLLTTPLAVLCISPIRTIGRRTEMFHLCLLTASMLLWICPPIILHYSPQLGQYIANHPMSWAKFPQYNEHENTIFTWFKKATYVVVFLLIALSIVVGSVLVIWRWGKEICAGIRQSRRQHKDISDS